MLVLTASNGFSTLEPVGIIGLPSGRTSSDNCGERSILKCHVLDLYIVNTWLLTLVGEEHGELAAVGSGECHEIVGCVGDGVVFLAVAVAGAVDEHPAFLRKPAEMHCHPEADVQHIMP